MTVILDFPPEIILHILSYLDLPDLAVLSEVAPVLTPLTSDPVLHKYRIQIVSPSRINHQLFGKGPHGQFLRPTIGDLVHRGVIRGLGIERRWRMGSYFYSINSIVQYENGQSLARRQACHVLSLQLRRRASPTSAHNLQSLYSSQVLPDIESSFPSVARSLLPMIRKLKWSLQRDKLAKAMSSSFRITYSEAGIGAWLEAKGHGIVPDGEQVRLALCPDVKKKVGFFERLAKS